jgi:hypothetical protein
MSGPVCVPAVRWARLNYPEGKKLWHAAVGHQAICGHVDFDHPRAEYSESKPERGRICRRCVAKLTLLKTTAPHSWPFEYDPTPLQPGETRVVVRDRPGRGLP